MFKPNESIFSSSLISSTTQKDFIDLIDQTNDNNVKNQYNHNELFQAEHDIKDYVINLKKQTINVLDDDSKMKNFQRSRKKKEGGGTIKNIKMKRKRSGFKKNADFQRRMSYNFFKVSNIYQNDNDNNSINIHNNHNNYNNNEHEIEFENDIRDDNNEIENSNNYNNSYITNDNKTNNINKSYTSFNTYSYQKSLDKIHNFIYKKKKIHTYEKNKNKKKLSNSPSHIHEILSKKYSMNKSLFEEDMSPMKCSLINNSFSFFKLPEIYNGENDSKSIENGRFLKLTHLSNKNILELNEIKKELKKSFVGQKITIDKNPTKSYLIDDITETKTNITVNENEKEKYRILTRKGYVYDSFDDEENIDEINYNFIHPDSNFIFFFDFFVFIFAFYNLISIPLLLGRNHVYCEIYDKFHFNHIINSLIDIIFIIDIIISFFIAYYNFDEILIIEPKLIAKNYLKTWFFIDLISAIPFQTFFTIFINKCKNEGLLQNPLYGKNFYYLLILFRLFKIFHVIIDNKFKEKLTNELSKYTLFNKYGNFLIHLIAVSLSLHIVACIFIFIGKNDYPNWIVHFNYNNKSFKELYLIAIYYTITTLTTVGYGDITCISSNEKIFGLFMEVIGICAYSWTLTEISNYIKVINEKTEELSNKIHILDDIKLNYPRLPNELYDRIIRYLRYQHYYEKKDKNIIIEELPIGLRNNLIYEMYKPVINNFTFFKDFSNIDFIVKVIVAFKPILSLKNDILIKDGDLVEDIIFVKRGRLSLEIPFHLIKPKKGKAVVKRNSTASIRRSTLFFNNITRENSVNNNIYCFSPTNNNQTLKNNFSFLNNTTNKNNTIKDKEEEENMQYYKILEIRRNEHFGDILMFLNQRSPLYLRVKSKKAELFFLNKQDAINISTSYPQYWKKINQKSLFNMQQIKRLINKIIKIISTEHVINPGRKYSKSNDDYGHLKSIYEDDLQTIPSFSKESDYTENDNENESVNQYENNDNNEYENYYESINNLNKDKSNEINQNDDVLKTILEDNIKEIQSSNEDNSLLSEEKKEKEKTLNLDSIINYSKINSTYKIKSFKSSTTPYKYDEINNEIYPEETFKISPQSNPNYQFTTYNHLKKTYLDNNSICSTEISFSINSEYENIDELSEGNYSKDISFRTTIKNFIQEEVKRKNNCNINPISYEENDNNNNTNINIKNNNDINIKKKGSYIPRRSSNFSLNHINKSKTRNNIFKMKSKDFTNKNTLKEDLNEKEDENKKNKNYMLSVISQNIEKDNLNLNNPELFYSEVFMKFMDRKMTKIKENNPNTEINKEDKDFIRRVTSISTMKYEFNKNYLSLKNKI